MPIDWPSSPALNERLVLGNRVWNWNGEGWERVINSGQVVSVLAPLDGPFILLNNPLALPNLIGNSLVLLTHI